MSQNNGQPGSAILLKNGRIIDPVNGVDQIGDLLILNGVIARVGPDAGASLPADLQIIDVSGKWITPGLIDMHVHLREPGDEYKETIVSGCRAAAAGGFTAVACMPNTRPVNDSQTITALILARAVGADARVYPVGSVSKSLDGKELAEIGEMKKSGVRAISDDGRPVFDCQLLRRALEYCANFDLLLISHAEEISLSKSGSMNEGEVSTRLGLQGIPTIAEDIMVYRDLAVASYTGRPIHIAHVSSREAVSLIRRAKQNGCRVTAETAPHYFTLTEDDVGQYDTNAKMNPPLRTASDREAIREGLRDGTLDAIATDHAPHSVLEKDVEFDQAANGIIGLETALPLTLNLVRDKIIDARRMVELLSVNPANILGVEGGALAVGKPADVTVIDPDQAFVYRKEDIVSKSKNSPFIDWELKGRAVLTILNGRVTCNRLG